MTAFPPPATTITTQPKDTLIAALQMTVATDGLTGEDLMSAFAYALAETMVQVEGAHEVVLASLKASATAKAVLAAEQVTA